MSTITNYIITASLAWDQDELDALNAELRERGECVFYAVHQNIGPGKAFEMCVLLCAGNYLEIMTVVDCMNAVEWREPDRVQLFACRDQDDVFSQYAWRLANKNDPRPKCIGCGQRWTPREGVDATAVECDVCERNGRL